MTHAISLSSTRFDRMSPTAAALAVLLHAATVLALWWVSPLNQRGVELDTENQAIDVTLERTQPEPPKPAPPAPPAPEPKAAPPPVAATPPPPPPPPPQPKATPVPLGLPPASPTTADTTKQAGPSTEQHRQAPDPQPQPATPAEPQKPSSDPQQATAVEKVAPPTPLERSLPPIDAPPPPTSKDIPKAPAPPPPPPKAHAAPATPTPPKQPLRPSPLSRPAPAPSKPNDAPAAAPSVTFVNPADQYEQSRLVDQYLSVVANKIAQYQYRSNQANEQGTAVLRLVISRDGQLIDVSIAQSSGVMNLDRGLIEAARSAAPFAPLPSGLPGPQIAFTVPFRSVYRR